MPSLNNRQVWPNDANNMVGVIGHLFEWAYKNSNSSVTDFSSTLHWNHSSLNLGSSSSSRVRRRHSFPRRLKFSSSAELELVDDAVAKSFDEKFVQPEAVADGEDWRELDCASIDCAILTWPVGEDASRIDGMLPERSSSCRESSWDRSSSLTSCSSLSLILSSCSRPCSNSVV